MSHANARFTPAGRLLMVQRIEAGTPQAHVARQMGLSRGTVAKWWHSLAPASVAGCRYAVVVSRRDDVLVRHRDEIVAAAKRNKARTISLVGSVARGEDTEDSDCDFLVDFEKGITLFGIGRLEVALEDLLGCSVDVVPRSCLRAHCRSMTEDAILL